MTPAERIIAKFGGVKRLSKLTGLSENSIYKWTYPKDRGGTGGLIPSERQASVLQAARENAIEVQPEDFFDLPREAAE